MLLFCDLFQSFFLHVASNRPRASGDYSQNRRLLQYRLATWNVETHFHCDLMYVKQAHLRKQRARPVYTLTVQWH